MHRRFSISLYYSLLRNPFIHCSKPTSAFLFKSFAPKSTQTFPQKSSLFKTPISSTFSRFNHPISVISRLRAYSSQEFDKNKIVDEINLKFAEAREEIEAAMESKETVYFNEEAECARAAVKEVLEMFDGLLGKLQVQEREALRRSMGLKIEQLKAELQQLDD